MPSILKKIELDLATYLYDHVQSGKMKKEEAGKIAQKALTELPENTPDHKLEKPLVKLSYAFPQLSSFFKGYLDEVREFILENLREEKLKGRKYE
ncbi:MAG: hypothetical protein M1514_01050 [Patescibacteria group bacterium]|nr:hypothetical protein [Patescibacteria group bacterium]